MKDMNGNTNTSRLLVSGGLCAVVLALVVVATGLTRPEGAVADEKADAKPYELVAPLEVIMEFSDDVFYEMPDHIEGKKFKSLKKDALFIAEMANVFKHAKDHRSKQEWQAYLSTMQGNLLKLAEAAEKKDAETSTKLHETIEKTCDSCHEDFRD